MNHKLRLLKKSLYIGTFLALQAGVSGSAIADIVITGATTPGPPASGWYWTMPDLVIGDASQSTSVTMDGTSVILAANSITMETALTNANTFRMNGPAATAITDFLDVRAGQNTIRLYDGANFETHLGANIQGTMYVSNATWKSEGNVVFDGNATGNQAHTQFNILNNAQVTIEGSLSVRDAAFEITNSALTFNTAAGYGDFTLSGSDLLIRGINSRLTTRSAIVSGTASANNQSSVNLLNGGAWFNHSDMLIGGAENVYFNLNRGAISNTGDITFTTDPGSIHIFRLDDSLIMARSLSFTGMSDMRYYATNNSRTDIANDLNFSPLDTGYVEVSGSQLRGGRFIVADGTTQAIAMNIHSNSTGQFNSGIFGLNGGIGHVALTGNSSLIFNGNLTLGDSGDTDFTLSSDSTLRAASLDIAKNAGSTAKLTVQDIGTPKSLGTIDVPVVNFGAGDGSIYFAHSVKAANANGLKQSDLAYQFAADVTGFGRIVQQSGDTSISGDYSAYTGGFTLAGGTLFVQPRTVLNNTHNFDIATRAVLDFDGGAQTIGDIYNNGGHVNFGDGLDAVLTVNNYQSTGISSMAMESGFANRPGLTDKMIVLGDTVGTTYLRVRDVERVGAESDDGIEVIEVRGVSDGEFVLMGDYTLPDGQQAVTHGAYTYTLQKGANTTRAFGANNWYMRRAGGTENGGAGNNGGGGSDVIYQPATSVYEAYPQALLALGQMPGLDEREGDKKYVSGASGGDRAFSLENVAFWTALEGRHIKIASAKTLTDTEYKQNSVHMKVGMDAPIYQSASGRLVAGGSVHYLHGNTDTRGGVYYGNGRIKTNGYGITPTLTWFGHNGFYADGQAMIARYESDLKSSMIYNPLAHDNKSTAYGFSAEIGQRIALRQGWSGTLQAQLAYSGVSFDTFKDTMGAAYVKHDHAQSLRGRIGGRVDYTQLNAQSRMNYFAGLNIYNQFLKAPKITVLDSFGLDPVSFKGVKEKAWVGLNGGASYSWNDDVYKFYGMVGASSPFSGFGDSYSLRGNIGLNVKF